MILVTTFLQNIELDNQIWGMDRFTKQQMDRQELNSSLASTASTLNGSKSIGIDLKSYKIVLISRSLEDFGGMYLIVFASSRHWNDI